MSLLQYLKGISTQPARIVGCYEGVGNDTLFIALGAMHGNEPAGVQAQQTLFEMLQQEPLANPSFVFKGCFLGLIGNMQAFQQGKRFISKDLNRQWTKENVTRIGQETNNLDAEDLELRELLRIIEAAIQHYNPKRLVLMDIHTTSAGGGIFSIPADNDAMSTQLATAMYAPVVQGLLKGIDGTTLHYFNQHNFNIPVTAVSFEAGQHYDTLSTNRAIAALVNCLREVGCLRTEDVENKHDQLLIAYSIGLPKVTEIIYCHHIRPDDHFKMAPNYRNFQKIKKGEILAYHRTGAIRAADDCLLLMPLYQKQGNDGFFCVKAIA